MHAAVPCPSRCVRGLVILLCWTRLTQLSRVSQVRVLIRQQAPQLVDLPCIRVVGRHCTLLKCCACRSPFVAGTESLHRGRGGVCLAEMCMWPYSYRAQIRYHKQEFPQLYTCASPSFANVGLRGTGGLRSQCKPQMPCNLGALAACTERRETVARGVGVAGCWFRPSRGRGCSVLPLGFKVSPLFPISRECE